METKINLNFNYIGILGIVFTVLKLCGVINWSWLWVLAPIWIPLSATIISLIVFYIWIKR